MEHDLYGRQKKIWKMLRKRKKLVTEEVQINNVTIETWEKHFRNLYKTLERRDDGDDEENNNNMDTLEKDNTEITIEEVKQAILKSKTRKPPDIDDIANELIKYGSSKIQ